MTYADEQLDVLALAPWRLFPTGDLSVFAGRHVGLPIKMRWADFCGYLSRGVAGEPGKYPDAEIAKRAEGGWTGGLYREGWRHHSAFVHTQLLTIDLDAHGDVKRAAKAFSNLQTAIHSTYKSTPDAPRCRVVILLSEPCSNPKEYKRAHVAIREMLYRVGYVRPDKKAGIAGDVDEGASDCTRLNYAPMHHPERRFEFATTAGEPLEIARIPLPTPRPIAAAPHRDRNPNRYREGAIRRAVEEVRTALPGQRHNELYRQVASLARADLGLTDAEIMAALGPAFIAAAGEARTHEAERTLRDAIAKGRAQ